MNTNLTPPTKSIFIVSFISVFLIAAGIAGIFAFSKFDLGLFVQQIQGKYQNIQEFKQKLQNCEINAASKTSEDDIAETICRCGYSTYWAGNHKEMRYGNLKKAKALTDEFRKQMETKYPTANIPSVCKEVDDMGRSLF